MIRTLGIKRLRRGSKTAEAKYKLTMIQALIANRNPQLKEFWPMDKYLTPKEWGQVIAKAWSDSNFKSQLESDPVSAVKKNFNFSFDFLFKTPGKPDDLSDQQLSAVADGQSMALATPITCC